MWNRGPLRQVFQISFKLIYRYQTAIEISTLLDVCIFKRSNPILWLIFQNSGIFNFFVTTSSENWVKRFQSCISCIKGKRKIKINIWLNFEVRSDVSNSKWVKKVQIGISYKINFKVNYCLWNCSFIILKFLLNLVTASIQNWLGKRFKLVSHVLMVIERWKSNVKGTLKWGIHLWILKL